MTVDAFGLIEWTPDATQAGGRGHPVEAAVIAPDGQGIKQTFAVVVAERGAVSSGAALLVGRAEPDHGSAGDQRRLVGFFRPGNGFLNRRRIVAVDIADVPPGGLETRQLVSRCRQAGGAVDRNAVVVKQYDKLG